MWTSRRRTRRSTWRFSTMSAGRRICGEWTNPSLWMKLDFGSVCFFLGRVCDFVFWMYLFFCLYVFLCVYIFYVHVYLWRMNKPEPLKMRLYLGCVCGWVGVGASERAHEEEREGVGGAKASHTHQIHSLWPTLNPKIIPYLEPKTETRNPKPKLCTLNPKPKPYTLIPVSHALV